MEVKIKKRWGKVAVRVNPKPPSLPRNRKRPRYIMLLQTDEFLGYLTQLVS